MPRVSEKNDVKKRFLRLDEAQRMAFPPAGSQLDAPESQGVYVIRGPDGRVLHVGRTHRGRRGLRQRLGNHLRGKSSFIRAWNHGDGGRLRQGCTYQYLVEDDPRFRALLEFYALAWHCPEHLGVGIARSIHDRD